MDYLARGLVPGRNYAVQVRSKKGGDVSEWSPAFNFTAAIPAAPTTVPGITATAQPMGYVVGVTGQTGVTDYQYTEVWASTTNGVTGTLACKITDDVQFVNNATFAPVYVSARFIDFWGQAGPWSAQVSVTPINPVITDTAAPSTPSALTVAQISVPSGAAGSINGIVAKVQAHWTCPPVVNANGIMDIAGFRLRYGIAGALPSVLDVPSTPVQPTQKQHAGTVASLTFSYHPFKVGDYVNVAISDAQFDGKVQVTGVTGTTGIVYTLGSSTSGLTSTTGWVIQNSIVLENVRPNLSYDYSINSYDEQFNLSAFSASTSYTATATAALDTSGLFKLGVGVSGANDGLYLNSNNYWFSGGAFSIGSGSGASGSIVWDGVVFRIDGKLVARLGTFNGNVEIQNGATLFMKGGASNPGTPGTPGTGQEIVLNYTGIQGFDSGHNAIFTLPTSGSAQIGGWFFGPSGLSAGGGSTAVGISPSNGGWSFWAGNATPASAPFRISNTGAMFASSATISGNITASSGSIAGVSIITAFPDLPNGDFESAIDTGADNWTTFWKGAGTTATRAAGEGVGGSYAYKAVVPALTASTLEWAGTIPVVPGEQYTLSAQIKASGVLTNSIIIGLLSGPTAFHTKFFDSQTNWTATEYSLANSATSYTTHSKTYTVPAGVYFIRPVIQMGIEATASIRTFWIDNVTLTRSGSFNALVSGSGLPGSETMKFMIADSGIISTTSKMAALPGKFALSGEVNATSLEGSSMRAVEYKSLGSVSVAANQTTYGVAPDAGSGLGTTFVAPSSGCVLILVSAILQSQDNATVVSYEVRAGGTLGSGTVVVAAATENGAYASGGAGGVELMNTSGFQSNYVSGLTPNATYNIRFMNYNADTVARTVQYRKLTIIPQL